MKHDNALQGRTVLVTGGSRGIGLAVARAALARGARVVLAARGPTQLASARDGLADIGGEVLLQQLDVTDDASVQTGVEQILARTGSIDDLIHCAGGASQGLVREQSGAALRAEWELNYVGMVRMVQAVLPHMQRRGRGSIVTVGSVIGFVGYPSMANYCAAKAAVARFTEAFEFEARSNGVHVMQFVPGHTRTAAIESLRLEGPPVADPGEVGHFLIDALCRRKRFTVHGAGNRAMLLLARVWPWYARYILRFMASRSLPAGTFGTPRRWRLPRPAPERAEE
ncbi:SDR family oxidoreductase [Ramlibacter sp. WS9]|uniref:SDR family NAD(P)-dependent oxidoreductase n=1 Tax=Ramlibacter sp. WS9 TaxID=1882741 RepID=UPI0011442828|nr:SDR family NAD(P)-dependent oxidoreductase [Ramlibacter sp. WS9]ROZ66553.1 SDR family NAD(P)-dependent oxidoreductase [Ramlibacter sp. WS9]